MSVDSRDNYDELAMKINRNMPEFIDAIFGSGYYEKNKKLMDELHKSILNAKESDSDGYQRFWNHYRLRKFVQPYWDRYTTNNRQGNGEKDER
ncbi:MAG TPA: hypothetical protein VGK47_09360 [Nitrososphaeraceae archaeon]